MKFARQIKYASLQKFTAPTAADWNQLLQFLDQEMEQIAAGSIQTLELGKTGTHNLMVGANPVVAVGPSTFNVKGSL